MPSCIAKPASANDVAEIVTTLVAANCEFAIKGRGHAPAAGFANIDHGVTIDMTGLSSIGVNNDHSVANVDAGASWLDVYAFLDPLNKTVAGGRNGAVGVGGLTLGGGISYFSPQVGWTCDTVVNFELVLPSGHLVNANHTSHPDLYRALKGGTNNFGIVTRFDFSTIPIGEILAGNIAHNISYSKEVFEAFINIANAPIYDVHASLVTSLAYSSTSKAWSLSSTPIYTLPIPNPPIYHNLFAIPNITNTMHLTPLHTLANETATPQLNFLFYTATLAPSSALLTTIFAIANATFHDSPPAVTWLVTLEPLPTAITARAAGNNVLGTSAADGNAVVLLLTGVWGSANATASMEDKAATVMRDVEGAARRAGLWKRFTYANYANARQDPVRSYGEGNEAFLKRVAGKYDGAGVWGSIVPGGFKL
tara:strand:- start:84 stop:1352 length:1269 start_codon:yes stop_codon:yes gene_type:complete